MSILDYDDAIFMNASSKCLHALDTVNYSALRFITNYKALTHRCSCMHVLVGMTCLLKDRSIGLFYFTSSSWICLPYTSKYTYPL